jgi:hypothetical protein
MRITESRLRRIISEELVKSNDILNESLIVEGVLQDLSGKVSQGAAIGLMMLALSGTANAKGFISQMNDTVSQTQSEESKADLEVEGIGNLQKEQDELVKKLRANPFGGSNILSDYIEKFEKMGESGDKIMKEVLSIFEKSPELKKKYSLVFRAFEKMSNKKVMKKIGF